MEMEMNMSLSATLEVSDVFDTVEEGQVKKLTRTFQTISANSAVQQESPMIPEPIDQTIDSASELEGKTVVFVWDADASEYSASFPDDEGDAELLEGLEQNMDLTVFLPAREVAEGDTWELDVQQLTQILMPGGDLKLVPDEEAMPDGLPTGGMGGNMADMLGDIEGEASAEYKGMREVDGVQCAVIQFKLAITSAADMTDKVADTISEQVPDGIEVELDHMDVEMEMQGEGTLLWNLAAGHAHSLELSATVNSVMDMGMSMDAGGQKMDQAVEVEMSGSVDITINISG